MKRIHQLFPAAQSKKHGYSARRLAMNMRQQGRARRTIRIAVVAFLRWIARAHAQRYDAAALLELNDRTLARWLRLWNESKLRSASRGRPPLPPHRPLRNDVIHLLRATGPHISCATLELFFPLMSRRVLRQILTRYRRLWRKKQRLQLHELRWHRPGSVWAIDYTDPPATIEHTYCAILVVRDLATGYQLLALPTPDQTAETACKALLPLFRKHGPPIVLKSDNGSFRAKAMTRFLEQWNVCPLLSPPRTPQYNGACEAGIGSIKTRAHHIAAQHARPGEWTCDDIEAARLLANATARPHGRRAPTPQAAWKRGDPITLSERTRFFRMLQLFQQRLDSRSEATNTQLGPTADTPNHRAASPSSEPPARTDRDAALFHRIAIRRTLVACRLLTLTTPRRITPPIKPHFSDKIT